MSIYCVEHFKWISSLKSHSRSYCLSKILIQETLHYLLLFHHNPAKLDAVFPDYPNYRWKILLIHMKEWKREVV